MLIIVFWCNTVKPLEFDRNIKKGYNRCIQETSWWIPFRCMEIMMTITERYLQGILPFLAGAEGGKICQKDFQGLQGYVFPCPFCSVHQKRDFKKRERCASLMPHQQSFSYTFNCCRKHSPECSQPLSFPSFLKHYNPSLFRKYHLEREQYGTTGKGHNLKRWKQEPENL